MIPCRSLSFLNKRYKKGTVSRVKKTKYLKRNNAPPFNNEATKASWSSFLTYRWEKKYPRVRYARPYFQEYSGNFTISLFLTGYFVAGSIFKKRLSSLGEEKHSWIFHGQIGGLFKFFAYVGKSRIIIFPININCNHSRDICSFSTVCEDILSLGSSVIETAYILNNLRRHTLNGLI